MRYNYTIIVKYGKWETIENDEQVGCPQINVVCSIAISLCAYAEGTRRKWHALFTITVCGNDKSGNRLLLSVDISIW